MVGRSSPAGGAPVTDRAPADPVDSPTSRVRNRSLDLRLVAVALATWLSAYAALHARVPVALAVAAVASVAIAVIWRCRDRGLVWAGVALAVLLGVVCGSAATAARLAGRDHPAIAGLADAHATVTVELTVRRDPHILGREFGAPASWLVPAWLHRIATAGSGDAVRVRARVLVLTGDPGWRELPVGQRVRATGRLAPPRGGDLTAAVLSVDEPPESVGLPPLSLRAANSLRAGLRAATGSLPPEPGGLLPGLAVGDVSNLDPALSDDFFTTGMTHLLSVSGANCVIITGFVFLIARAVRAPPWLTAAVSGLALVGYVLLCRAEPSVLRAGVMGLIALIALATGNLRAALPALAATVVVLVVIDPQLAGSPGFAMSVLATGGILLLAPRWRDGLRRCRVPAGLAEALAVPAAAQVAVSPVIAGLSGTVSLVSVAANLAAAPAVAPATILGVLAAAVSPVAPAVAQLLAWLGSWPAWWLVLVARHGAQLPAAVVPWPDGTAGALLLAAVTVAGLLALRHRRLRIVVAVVVAAAVAGALPVRTVASGWPPDGTVAVACAVGQGDLLVIPVADGAAIVVDAGPEPAAADRCLRDLRVHSVPLLVISHYHADHVGGLDGVLRGRQVAAVLAPALPEPEPGHELVTETLAAAIVPVQVPLPGAGYQIGEVRLTVLGPPQPLAGTRSDPNNNSLVIRAEVRGVSVLLTGDAEEELQRALLDRLPPELLRADVLKVAHHGSAYQELAFIDAVAPQVALVPVGADNAYGHPHPSVMDRLAAAGVAVLRTDTDGDVAAVQPTPGRLAVVARPLPPGSER